MAAGKVFKLTDKRLAKVLVLLGKQYSLRYIGREMGIAEGHLRDKLKEAGVDIKKVRLDGLNTLKADAMGMIATIEEPEKKFAAAMAFLKQYDKSEDVATVEAPKITFEQLK